VRPANAVGLIVVEDRNGKPYKHRRMTTVHHAICDAAELPKDIHRLPAWWRDRDR
jgi:hypothetical protein